MTAEQSMIDGIARNLYQREQYLKTGRISADLFTESVGSTQSTYRRWARFLLGETVIDSPVPLAAHVREAAQGELAQLKRGDNPYLAAAYAMAHSDIDLWKSRAETAERKLAELEKEYEHALICMDRSCKRCVAALASLRAESKEG